MAEKNIENKYRKLTDIEHVLNRASVYIGSTKIHKSDKWLFNSEIMLKTDIDYNPGFMKIFDEIIVNSVDESRREGSKLNTIKVNVKDNTISIWDNGGIPVVIHKEYNEWVPEMIFSNLKSGSNFDDNEDRITSGLNGMGSVLTNIFSTKFTVSTCDKKNHFYQEFYNNLSDRTEPQIIKSKENHTQITFSPDFKRFNMNNLDEVHYELIKKRVIDIAGCNPDLKIYFNDELIKIKTFEDYIKMYTKEYVYEINKENQWCIGVSKSNEGFQQVSFVNSTETFKGGSHTDYILSQILTKLREFFLKKHKVDVKPSEIKNHLFLFIKCDIINPGFSSQTKEELITEIKDFGFYHSVSDKFITAITKSEIINSILDWIEKKKNAEENKLSRELNKSLAKLKVDKLIDAKGKDRSECSLYIFEGDSASSAYRKYRTPETQGAFSLRGKFLNVHEIANNKLLEKTAGGEYKNKEAVNLMAAIGLKLGEKAELANLRYGKILFFCDADYDGSSIVGLLINFLFKYWPELFQMGLVFMAKTPIVVCKNTKKKNKLSFYSQAEFGEWEKNINHKEWEIKYKKGLAALVDDEYKEIIQNPKLAKIDYDNTSEENLNIWFGKDAELRKKQILC